jgi:DNA-binding transcriptional LysR family regulator
MQLRNWNDLRFLLAIKRGLKPATAAKLLSIDDTTVSRRLAAVQTALGEALFVRRSDGTLTATGEIVAQCAEAMERQIDLVGEATGPDYDHCASSLRLTAVPISQSAVGSCNRKTAGKRPALQIELIPRVEI